MIGPVPSPITRRAHYAAAFTLQHDPSGSVYTCAECGAYFGTNERAAVLHAFGSAETHAQMRRVQDREHARIVRLTTI